MQHYRSRTLPAAYFDAIYAAHPDPWGFATSDYERAKYHATLAALRRPRYRSALEVGCSIGVFTRLLAPRCDRLLAVDAAALPLGEARRRCADFPHVAIERRLLPREWPRGRYDLVMLSEMLFFLDRDDVRQMAAMIRRDLLPGGDVVLVHWTGETDYPLTADEAAGLLTGGLIDCEITAHRRARHYRLDVLSRRRSPG